MRYDRTLIIPGGKYVPATWKFQIKKCNIIKRARLEIYHLHKRSVQESHNNREEVSLEWWYMPTTGLLCYPNFCPGWRWYIENLNPCWIQIYHSNLMLIFSKFRPGEGKLAKTNCRWCWTFQQLEAINRTSALVCKLLLITCKLIHENMCFSSVKDVSFRNLWNSPAQNWLSKRIIFYRNKDVWRSPV